jgi:hypothetical protein
VKPWRELNNAHAAMKRISLRSIVVAPSVFVGSLAITSLPVLWSDEIASRGRPRRAPAVTSEETSHPTVVIQRPELSAKEADDIELKADNDAASVPKARFNVLAISTEPLPSEKPSGEKSVFLASGSAEHFAKLSQQHFDQARQLYSTGALASAEASLWLSLEAAAESVSKSQRWQESGLIDPRKSLDQSRTAILEARDFSGRFGDVDSTVIARMIRSHRTQTLKKTDISQWSGVDASDAYLDYARTELAGLATHSVSAARSLDLLAAVTLKRDDSASLPSATAICLRRAALQGQPNNASLAQRLSEHLADVGLHSEAHSVLAHAQRVAPMAPSAAPPVMQIETMSPEQFAALSRGQTLPTVAPMVQAVSHNSDSPDQGLTQVPTSSVMSSTAKVGNKTTSIPPSPIEAQPVEVRPSLWSRMVPSIFRGNK